MTETRIQGPSESWISIAREAIRKLRSLPDDWHAYGAEAPNGRAIANANSVIGYLAECRFQPSRIVPSGEGGVSMTFEEGGLFAMIEFLNSGISVAGMMAREGSPESWEFHLTPADVATTVRRIRDFIGG